MWRSLSPSSPVAGSHHALKAWSDAWPKIQEVWGCGSCWIEWMLDGSQARKMMISWEIPWAIHLFVYIYIYIHTYIHIYIYILLVLLYQYRKTNGFHTKWSTFMLGFPHLYQFAGYSQKKWGDESTLWPGALGTQEINGLILNLADLLSSTSCTLVARSLSPSFSPLRFDRKSCEEANN